MPPPPVAPTSAHAFMSVFAVNPPALLPPPALPPLGSMPAHASAFQTNPISAPIAFTSAAGPISVQPIMPAPAPASAFMSTFQIDLPPAPAPAPASVLAPAPAPTSAPAPSPSPPPYSHPVNYPEVPEPVSD